MCLVPASGELWALRSDSFKSCKNGGPFGKNFVAGFAKNKSLYRRIDQYSELYVSTCSVAVRGRPAPLPPPPLIFRAKWGPKGEKNFFGRPGPPAFFSGSGIPTTPPAPTLIWRSGSATAHFNECESGSFFIRKKNNNGFWLHLMEDWFIYIIW